MAGRRSGRRLAIVGVSVTLLALGVIPASAHYIYQEGDVYESTDFNQCVTDYAKSSHGEAGNGYMKGIVYAFKSWTDGTGHHDCTEGTVPETSSHWNRPSQNIAIRDYYFRLNNNPGDKSFPKNWSLCEYSDWFYNQKTSYSLSIAGEMRGPTICGASYYGTLPVGDVNNGNWIGGSIWSGGHKLPTSPSVDGTSSTAEPSDPYTDLSNILGGSSDGEAAPDGVVNPTLGTVTVAGPDGNPVDNPLTGQPYLVDLNALSTPPTNLPGNVTQLATDLAGEPTNVVYESLPPTTDAVPRTAQLNVVDEEFYVVPMHVAAEALTGAP